MATTKNYGETHRKEKLFGTVFKKTTEKMKQRKAQVIIKNETFMF